ncbi:helix-turn-helix domain-containing protein [Microvirga lenta]|uniref:helix-turn-helix domain-containing protein n=1 Tax=Microvirga lenta TaxID=2881337 RepID=UPI001CFFF90E|nr:XRE family transcriptional regulator [Microvirga lenta]MCB5175237.1 XRE family transcriptional regulator [Microvirga lenta]
MLSETLAAGLEQYKIGAKIRTLRLKKKLGLAQLGEHTGLSPAMLSKIERGQLFPTLPTLLRIALVFGVGLEHFFVEGSDRPTIAVVRKEDRLRLPDRPGDAPSYFFESLDFPVTNRRLQAYYAEFPAGSQASESHQHDGAELVYVLRGRLAISIAGDEIVLEEGDAMYFDSGAAHSYRQEGPSACSAMVVTAPE